MKKHLLLLLSSAFLVSACSTKSKAPEKSKVPAVTEISEKPNPANGDATEMAESIDEVALQRALGLDRPDERLGYAKKTFDTCQVGYGYSKVHNCRARHFVVVHFQMLCRDSEGTVSEVVRSQDMIKNADRDIRWEMKDKKGTARTDRMGYAQIRMISPKSQAHQRLKIAIDSDFLYLKAGEVNRIVTPRSWCR